MKCKPPSPVITPCRRGQPHSRDASETIGAQTGVCRSNRSIEIDRSLTFMLFSWLMARSSLGQGGRLPDHTGPLATRAVPLMRGSDGGHSTGGLRCDPKPSPPRIFGFHTSHAAEPGGYRHSADKDGLKRTFPATVTLAMDQVAED